MNQPLSRFSGLSTCTNAIFEKSWKLKLARQRDGNKTNLMPTSKLKPVKSETNGKNLLGMLMVRTNADILAFMRGRVAKSANALACKQTDIQPNRSQTTF